MLSHDGTHGHVGYVGTIPSQKILHSMHGCNSDVERVGCGLRRQPTLPHQIDGKREGLIGDRHKRDAIECFQALGCGRWIAGS